MLFFIYQSTGQNHNFCLETPSLLAVGNGRVQRKQKMEENDKLEQISCRALNKTLLKLKNITLIKILEVHFDRIQIFAL